MNRVKATRTVIAGALGECVHIAGVMNFLRLAEAAGWRTVFLGPAVSVEKMLEAVRVEKGKVGSEELIVGVSYRLTPKPVSVCWAFSQKKLQICTKPGSVLPLVEHRQWLNGYVH